MTIYRTFRLLSHVTILELHGNISNFLIPKQLLEKYSLLKPQAILSRLSTNPQGNG